MLSFNHYAYGAVIDWVYRHVAGLAPDRAQPGYRHVVFAPRPCVGIDWARASVESAYGPIRTDWRIAAGEMTVDVELPFGTTATFTAPVTPSSSVAVDGRASAPVVDLGPGRHTAGRDRSGPGRPGEGDGGRSDGGLTSQKEPTSNTAAY